MRLYDMEKDEWRQVEVTSRNEWRSDKVYRCRICGCLSNAFSMWGHEGQIYSHPKLSCPGERANKALHEVLQAKIHEREKPGKPASYLKELYNEIRKLRRQFLDIAPDVAGVTVEGNKASSRTW